VIDVGIFFGRPDRSQALAERLPRRGFRITVYGDQATAGPYVPVACSLPAALACLRTARHDVYLTGLAFAPPVALCLNRVARGRPYVFNATGVLSAMYRQRSLRWPFPRLAERTLYPLLERCVFHGAAAIVCNSRYLAQRVAGSHPATIGRLTTIYNGIDFPRLERGRRLEIDGVPDTAPTLLAVATWEHPAKTEAGRLLIDAMGHIVAARPEVRLVIAVRARHRRWARANDAYLAGCAWRDAVRIFYNRTDIPDLLASADVFLYATSDESNDSLPRALIEAQAAGLPTVATAAAGCAEVVEHGATGFVVERDPAAIARHVLALIDNRALRRRLGACGRERVRDVFSWDRMADRYAEVLRAVATAMPA
jgi:glycosyltransferase involved in cell wall biosynthesis